MSSQDKKVFSWGRAVKGKKGVSEVVGYILLISIAVAMSVIVYAWLKSYVPKEPLECPGDISLMIKDINCTADGIIDMTLRNNGKFSIYAYTIKYAKDPSKTIATDSLAKAFRDLNGHRDGEVIYFMGGSPTGDCTNVFEPGNEVEHQFDMNILSGVQTAFIDITPIRCQQQEGKIKSVQVRCNDARIRQPIVCPIA
ncbi:Uncharacterised protein [uncultured archaeon]|nr:Uncharacterised protein [uncultured archaeon]